MLWLYVEYTDYNFRMKLVSQQSSVSIAYLQSVSATLTNIVSHLVSSPQTLVRDLEYLDESNRRLLFEWNQTPLVNVEDCIQNVIYQQVLANPNKEAICAWDGALTYQNLWTHVQNLALTLSNLGVGPEVIVPLCFDKSVWATVAMLAVLEAGGAFCPLDASQPASRLESLMSRLDAKLILCSRQHTPKLSNINLKVLPIDAETVNQKTSPTRTNASLPNNTAYILWTSGSTGEPKGVVIEHGAYCSGARAHATGLGMHKDSRALQYASYIFDSSIVESLTILMIGATVCVPSEYSRLNDLPAAINELNVNWVALTPSAVNFLDPPSVPSIKTLLLMGEAMSRDHMETWAGLKLINGYGPAETSVAAVSNLDVQRFKEPTMVGNGLGVRCWLVDPENHDRLVPPGCIGELLVEGNTLARGYLNDPKKTADAFITNPAWSVCHRMYKTGDLMRYHTSNGMLIFVGRKDSQVKLHGQRIELGEIEHCLTVDAEVRQVLLVVPKEGLCSQRLVAVLALEGTEPRDELELLDEKARGLASPIVAQIRDRLTQKLPAFMIPSVWLVASGIPLLRSGKLDRKQVSAAVSNIDAHEYSRWVGAGYSEQVEKPATEVESKLRMIWSHVLNLLPSQISLRTSFISLGGDSISAMMVQNQCKKETLNLTVQDILRAKSITHLATLSKTTSRRVQYDERVEEDFDLSPIQRLYFELPREKGHFNQSFFVRLTQHVQPAVVHQATKTIIGRHSMLRARFRLSDYDGEWKQRITSDVAGSYAFHNHQDISPEAATRAMSKSQASLDPVNGPMFSVDFFNLPETGQQLFMTGHHLVIDLVSWRVILEEVEDLLAGAKSMTAPEPSMSFQEWCKIQIEDAHSTPLNTVLPIGDIPRQSFDYWGIRDDANTYGNVRCEQFELDTTATSMITSKCHVALGTDVVDVLVAAMIHSFSPAFPDRPPPAIFNEGHGREVWDPDIDLSRTIGWFTTMYPIHVETPGSYDFMSILERVKDFRRAVPNKGRPYFASRMLTSKGEKKFRAHWPLEFTFNYLGIYQQLEREGALLQPADEMAGESREAGGRADYGIDTPRFGLFEISAVIARGKLRFSFTYNRNMQHQDRIIDWVSLCKETLVQEPLKLAQIAHRPTLSDFSLISLTYDSLDQLMNETLPALGVCQNDIEDIYRCSEIQQGLLISTQRDAAFYAISGTYEVKARNDCLVDTQRLEQAWQAVVDRHPSLRTIFIESQSTAEDLYDQVVLKRVQADIARVECASEADVTRSFDSQSPMEQKSSKPSHRFTVCRTQSQVFCKLELSHLIVDGASISQIFKELVSVYQGDSLDMTPGYSSYIDFLQKKQAKAGIGYWKSYLSELEPTTFPVMNDSVNEEKKLHSLHLDWTELGGLQEFCDIHGVTLANIFHTAWALTLQCYTGAHDVCFGYLSSTRDQSIENVEHIVGYLVNMLVCRVSLDSDMNLVSVMQQVQKDLSTAQGHAHTALSEVLHAVKAGALFNTSLSYRRLPMVAATENEISFHEHAPYHDPTEYPVSINVEVSDERAAIDLDYWTDSLSDGNAENVMNTFRQALSDIIEKAENAIGSLCKISQADREKIATWNSEMPETIERCVHDVVSEQVMMLPQAEAVCAWDANFTYTELDTLAQKLAGYLNLFGVGPETYVCLCFEKSAYTIVSMLAVLKAGGAFVALDPMHPIPALELRIKETEAQVILTSPCYKAIFSGMDTNVASVDKGFLDRLQGRKYSLQTPAAPHNPCCVIYTSGSTGRPKGVVLEHKALVTSSRAHGTALHVGRGTRFLQFSSYTFDNNLEEIFTTLMRGGTVCVPSDHDRMNDLATAATSLKANFMDLTPTVATYLDPSKMPTIKGMALGGEALTKAVLDVWGGKVQIHNQYGPSECSINAAHRTDISKSSDPASIGRSVGSVSWLVNPTNHHELVSIGCEGELLIEGPILSRGYLRDGEKTSKAFVEDPDWSLTRNHSQARRMYKTGDLVRYNSDGTMAYIGRKDQQVKLNGQRIELGEIEYHARTLLPPDWQFAVELIVPGTSRDAVKTLATFVCPGGDTLGSKDGLLPVSGLLQASFATLEAELSKVLPKHMVPSMYIPMVMLPLTSSGKLDRKQLHATAKGMTENQVSMYRLAGSSGRAPSTMLEKTLAGLWESVLGLEAGSIGMDAQFFRMGGDSIAAIRLVSVARSQKISLTVADIFRNATLSEMCENANMSDSAEAEKAGPEPFELLPEGGSSQAQLVEQVARLCQVESSSVEDIYPCTPIQEGLIALSSRQTGAYTAKNVYRLSGLDLDLFKDAWQRVVAEENILRTRIVFVRPLGFLQVVVKDIIEWSDQTNLRAHEGGKLTEYSIVTQSATEASFLWTVHHAVYDGWSVALILNKVQAYYKGLKAEESVPYPRFIQYLSQINLDASDRFWQSRLAETSSPQFPALPNPVYQPSGSQLLSTKINVSRESSTFTLPTAIRAAWAAALSSFCNSDDIVFGETISGRDAPVAGIVDIIGPTFSSVPNRIRVDRDLTVAGYLEAIQNDFTASLPYQNAGLQRIKRIGRDTAKACDFQNLIAINSASPDSNDDFWKLRGSGDVGTDFFTYGLTISFDISPSDIQVSAHYDSSVIPAWELDNLLKCLGVYVTRIVGANQMVRLGEIMTIHAEDEAQIQRWNSSPVTTINRCIHKIIADRVGKSPAIHAWDVHFTYLEMDNASTALAHQLLTDGIIPHSYVPVCFEKSGVTIIAMLALLKAGASFVPLDPDAPRARLQGIVDDLDAGYVVCSPKYEQTCKSLGLTTLTVDLKRISEAPSSQRRLPAITASDIAYVIFTSGSTGKPKGTLVSHSAFSSGAFAHGPAMQMTSDSRVFQFASYIFDASILEIFSTLLLGGCICVPDEKRRLNDTAAVMNELNVNWALLTPSFVQMISPASVPGLKTLVLGGEAVSQNHVDKWASKTHLINAYGPSECAVVATANTHVLSSSKPANIGRAVGGHGFVVSRDDHSVLTPIGATGELVIHGPILANGYLKNQSKTEESFVRAPPWMHRMTRSDKESLIYKTGDLVKYTEDGSFIYCGRKDNQSKIHGQRLELGEIEHHLMQNPLVRHAMALIPATGHFEKRLVAVISFHDEIESNISCNGLSLVSGNDSASHTDKLRDFLGTRLQIYMIPSSWIAFTQIPMLPSGKLDRRRVASIIEDMPDDLYLATTVAETSNQQGNDTEQRLQAIWADVLNLQQVRLDKSFFLLGGDSISALQILSQCRAEGMGITVQDIIRSSSISDLATRITLPVAVSYEAEEFDKPFDLAPIQKLFFAWMGGKANHFNQSIMLRLPHKQESKKIASAIGGLVNIHSMLRARFEKDEFGTWTQKLIKDSNYAFRSHSSPLSNRQIDAKVEASQKGLDIERGPLLAVDLFSSSDDHQQVLSIVAHHLVIDVISWGVILEDLEHLLHSGRPKTTSSLPFQSWSRAQSRHTSDNPTSGFGHGIETPRADYAYWSMHKKPNVYGDSCDAKLELDEVTTRKLAGDCNAPLGTEIVDILLGSILHSFVRAFPDRRTLPCVFNEAHGREPWDPTLDLSHTVGWFTTISPVMLPPEAAQETSLVKIIRWVKDMRSRTKDKGRQYFAHRMLTASGQEKLADHWPMEIAFNYLGQEKSFKRSGTLLEPLERASAFDIGADVPRFALFEISASISDDKLKMCLSYNRNTGRRDGVETWVRELGNSLRLASQRLLKAKTEPTMSDFPLLPLGYNSLTKLKERLPAMKVDSLSEVQDIYGCTPMQRGILLSQIKDNGHYMYDSIFKARHSRPVDQKRLALAWEKVVQKHASLRTVFVESLSQEGLMDQAVVKRVSPKITYLNNGDAVTMLQSQRTLSFSDAQPHHHLTLCEDRNGEVYCKFEISHALCDGTSIPIILQDLASMYHDVQMIDGPLYSDFVAHIQKSSYDDDVSYWRRYLEDVEPCDFPSLTDGVKRERTLHVLEKRIEQGDQLHAFCAREGVTVSNVLQLVWSLVLRVYTGNDSVCFGYLSSGRDVPIPNIENAVGLFISMLVCRMDLSDGLQVGQALQQIQNDFAQSMAHQAYSLGEMQHELQLSGKSLFNTAFTFQRRSTAEDKDQLEFEVLQAHDPSEYDLTVNVEAYDSGVDVHFNYWADFMSDDQISHIAETFAQVLRSITSGGQQIIKDIDVCSSAHRQRIQGWNGTSLPDINQCVHDVIRLQAQSLPRSAPAVSSWDVDLTYPELISHAERLATHLKALGVGPETYVPICFYKSTWAVVAIMGVLQAGGAFVPLDPSHPESRIKFILESISAKTVLCSEKTSDKFTGIAGVTALTVNEALLRQPQPLLKGEHSSPNPSNAAYLIFTSGTTGLPKGTIISHQAFATGATEHAPAILMRKGARVLQFSNLSFDASVMEILTSLITGACICIPSDDERMNDIPGAISRMSVTWTLLTPSVANVLDPDKVPTLKVLVTGGEAMQAKHIAKWHGKTALVNAYGPSECAVIATTSIKIGEHSNLVNEDPSNIGHAVGGHGWVVNAQDHNKLVPIGSIGELVVEGNTVSRGYLNNEEKTSKAFVPRPPWMGTAHGLVYKTGDLVRYNSDGSFAYVGRKDTQVKLKGLRIELGEIEHHVKRLMPPHVQSAVEVVAPAGKQATLAAFLASSENVTSHVGAPSSSGTGDSLLLMVSDATISLGKTLKANLGGSLPAYMIPTLFIPISRMPITSSGKLDRSRLRKAIAALSTRDTVPFKLENANNNKRTTKTETDMEKALRSMWQKILHLEPETISADDSFFVLGGDSVQAMRLVAACRAQRISLSVLDIFRKPLLSDMAGACSRLEEDDEAAALQPFGLLADVEPLDRLLDEISTQCRVDKDQLVDAYPCTSLQAGLITLSIKQAGSYVAHNVFRLPDAVDLDQFKAAWEKAIDEMDILRTRIVHTTMSTFVQAVLRKESLKWYSTASTEEAIDSMPPLPEHNGSQLMRFAVVGEETDRLFVWSIHHALYDGWSMPKMLQRVEDIYLENDQSSPKASYSHYIRYLSQTDTNASDRFWKTRFEDLEAATFPKQSAEGHGTNASMSEKFVLNSKTSMPDITVPSIIRAAWAILMSAHSGSDDVVFGETLTGRDVPVDGIIDMLGPTLTTVPTRVRIDKSLSIHDFLRKVHQMAAEVIPYQHVGLSSIRRLSPDTAAACDFQNLLVIQNAGESSESKMWDPVNTGVGSNFFTYPLVLECTAGDKDMHLDVHYDDTVLSKWHVERLVYQFSHIVNQLLAGNSRLSELQVTSADDVALLQDWNNYKHVPVEACIHDLFMQQASLTPQRQAVCAWDGDLTYEGLHSEAKRLSKYLVSLGVGPEILVPFCMDKSKWAVVAQVGILMSGAGMVPLDPSHPSSRHAEIIKDTASTVMLCSPAYQTRYSSMVETVIPLDERTLSSLNAPRRPSQSKLRATAKSIAYVIFTSGSTGRPKGVVIEHEAFCSSSKAYGKAMMMTPDSRVFNFASVTFDVGLMENMSPLTMGATVCMPNNEAKMLDLAKSMEDLKATWSFLTPSVANLIEPSAVPSLDVLVCGGEAMSKENVLKWADKVKLVNGYGPTETAVITIVNDKVSQQKNPSIIGFGHGNCHTWITDCDDHNRLAPLGCAGELLLEGPILAREYLHDAEKTAKAFVSNLSWAQCRRFYKTGDLARYNSDGSITYIGRKDNQIKLNGQRIELGEIEHNIEIHARTQHSVTMLPKTGPCKGRIVAALSMADRTKTSAANSCELLREKSGASYLDEIKDFVSGQLPIYMVPSIWVILENVPMLVSGKLDRKQVERYVENMSENDYQYVTADGDTSSDSAPITPTVQQLREVWAAVFNLPQDQVDPSKSFMSMGGDSLISMSIIARCRKIGIVLGLQEILTSKSLFQVAKIVDSKGGAVRTGSKMKQEEKLDQLFDLSPVQQLYFQMTKEQSLHGGEGRFNQSQTLRLGRKVDTNTVEKAVQTIAQQHSMFRVRFAKSKEGGQWQQKIIASSAGSYRFRHHEVAGFTDTVPLIATSQRSLDIENGPLFAVEMFTSQSGAQIISLIAHHLVIDVVSWGIVLQQMEELLSDHETVEKPLPFQTWCSMQNDHANQKEVKTILPFNVKRADLGFWDMANRKNVYGDVTHSGFILDKPSSDLVLGKANKAMRTQPIEILTSALIHSFKAHFPTRAMPTIFNESHGRDAWDPSIDLSGTTGWFTSLCPIQVATEDSEDMMEVLKRTKDVRRSIPENGRDYFAHRYLTPDGRFRFGDHMPMEILFNYTGRARGGESGESLFQPIQIANDDEDEILIADVGRDMTRMALFEVSASVVDEQIHFSFMFNKHMKYQEEIFQWVAECKHTLGDMVKQLASVTPQPTLSDYPLLPTTYKGLGKHISETFDDVGISGLDEVEDMLICAPTQQGLLLSQLRNPNQYVNFVISEINLSQGGRVDVQRLVRAWQKVVDRHQSLRTAFVYSVCKGHAFDQIVLKKAAGDARVLHCKSDEWEQVEKTFEAVSMREINKTRRPQLPHQLSVCTTPSGKGYTKLELNHAVIDGGSGALMTRDLSLAYEGMLPGDPKPLYSDYIKYINRRSDKADVTFWKKYLHGIERCYIPKLKGDGGERTKLNALYMKFDRWAELQQFCRNNALTLSNVLLAGWGLVLRQYTSRDDVCFGNLTAGRDAPVEGIQDTVGAFINMLVCRVGFRKSDTLKDIFLKVQTDYLDMLPYQHCSLARIQHDLGFTGEALYNTAASIQNQMSTRDAEKEGDAIDFDPITDHDPTEYSVTVNIRSAPGDEGVRLKHWTSEVSVEEGEKLARAYADTLSAILEGPDQTIADFRKGDKAQEAKGVRIALGPNQLQKRPTDVLTPNEPPAISPFIPGQSPFIPDQTQGLTSQGLTSRELVKDVVKEVVGQIMQTQVSTQMTDIIAQTIGTLTDAQSLKSVSRRGSLPEVEPDQVQLMLKTLRSLWSPLLDIPEDEIQLKDSFFVLGGDSVLAMELAGSARDLGHKLSTTDIFDCPALCDMAEVIIKNNQKAMSEPAKSTRAPSVASHHQEQNGDPVEDESNSRFALVQAGNTESFIQDHVCPKIGVFRGGIVDVLPVTDFQSLAIAGSLLQPRWMLNYLFFDGRGSIDIDRLKKCAFRLVQNFEILRTLFISCGDRFLQVVLRTLRPPFQVHDTDEDPGVFLEQLRESGQDAYPKLGQPMVQFMVIRKTGTNIHRIVIRLSHAQYDGISLPKMMHAFQMGYEGKAMQVSPAFSNYVIDASGTASDAHYDYWTKMLRGSTMTHLVERGAPSYETSERAVTVKKTIELPTPGGKNITVATILKATWAYVLAQLTGRTDVVFGTLISGRNEGVSGIENIAGPCINLIPVRVKLDPRWTAMDLLRKVQSQQVASMPFESLGFREIVQRCTEWPEWTYFSSTVQHQNIAQDTTFKLDRNKYKVGFLGVQDTLSDLSIVSTPKEGDLVEIALGYQADGPVTPDFVDKALEMICSQARALTSNPNAHIQPITDQLITEPMIQEEKSTQKGGSDTTSLPSMLRKLKKQEVFDVTDTLRRAWKTVLPAQQKRAQQPSAVNIESSFYDLGGDLVSLANLAAFLEAQGYVVRLEDLIERPTIGEQIVMLASQHNFEGVNKPKQGSSGSGDGKEKTNAKEKGEGKKERGDIVGGGGEQQKKEGGAGEQQAEERKKGFWAKGVKGMAKRWGGMKGKGKEKEAEA